MSPVWPDLIGRGVVDWGQVIGGAPCTATEKAPALLGILRAFACGQSPRCVQRGGH